jgi:hypothetical protein
MQSWPPPIVFQDATLHGFVLKGSHAAMQSQVDTLLNEPAAGAAQYLVLSDYALLYFATFPHSYFASMQQMGWSTEREVGIWIPVIKLSVQDGVKVAVQLCCFTPYIFVDNAVALTAGREVYGFFKEYGWISLPDDPGSAASGYGLETIGAKVFSPQTEIKRIGLLTVTPTSGAGAAPAAPAAAPTAAWSSPEEAMVRIARVMGLPHSLAAEGLQLAASEWDRLLKVPTPLVFLKQFRDVGSNTDACYQAITEASAAVSAFRGVEFASGFDFELQDLASHPIGTDLGITSQSVAMAFSSGFDMTFLGGTTLAKGAAS